MRPSPSREDWQEDARRRDFTLNALYAGSDGELFDPLGGYADLAAGRVRFIGDAKARIKEDYLRILRFFRFNAYYGKGPLDAAGLAACVQLRAGLDQLSAERVAGELRKLLVAPQAVRAVEALFDYGLLTQLLGGVPRLLRFARLVAAEEALGLPPDAALRLAALAVFVREDAERLAARLRLSNNELAVLLLGADDHAAAELPDEAAAKRALYRLGPCSFEAHVLLASADAGIPPEDQAWRQALRLADRWDVPEFPLRGPDIMALGEAKGPAIGEILRQVEAEWVAGGFAAIARDAARTRVGAQPKITQARPISVAPKASTTGSAAISINTSRPRSSPVAVLTVPSRNSRKLVCLVGQRGSPRL